MEPMPHDHAEQTAPGDESGDAHRYLDDVGVPRETDQGRTASLTERIHALHERLKVDIGTRDSRIGYWTGLADEREKLAGRLVRERNAEQSTHSRYRRSLELIGHGSVEDLIEAAREAGVPTEDIEPVRALAPNDADEPLGADGVRALFALQVRIAQASVA